MKSECSMHYYKIHGAIRPRHLARWCLPTEARFHDSLRVGKRALRDTDRAWVWLLCQLSVLQRNLLILAGALEIPLKDLTEGVPAPRERRSPRHPKRCLSRGEWRRDVMVEQDVTA